ncbi:hypothetical protein B566_EDAN011126 [Ephemera danica]|nr:hypothetical protein B566_EDAN011126 [Ephemera danica]
MRHCETDYINIYQGSTASGPLLNTVCGNRKIDLNFTGPNLLLEFSSGPPIPPYDYNGFVAFLEFNDSPVEAPHTETSVVSRTTDPAIAHNGKSAAAYTEEQQQQNWPRKLPNAACDFAFFGNSTRSGSFDTRMIRGWPQDRGPATCRLIFQGRRTDMVHVSFFNFELSSSSCESSIEIFDGTSKKGSKPVQKICSPASRITRDPIGRFVEQQNFLSSGNTLTVLFRFGKNSQQEKLDGTYLFHDGKQFN